MFSNWETKISNQVHALKGQYRQDQQDMELECLF